MGKTPSVCPLSGLHCLHPITVSGQRERAVVEGTLRYGQHVVFQSAVCVVVLSLGVYLFGYQYERLISKTTIIK